MQYGLLSPYFALWAQYGLWAPYFACAQYGLWAPYRRWRYGLLGALFRLRSIRALVALSPLAIRALGHPGLRCAYPGLYSGAPSGRSVSIPRINNCSFIALLLTQYGLLVTRGCAALTPGCILAPLQGALFPIAQLLTSATGRCPLSIAQLLTSATGRLKCTPCQGHFWG